ncbi:MAG: dihydropteroate synthase [Planctomycetes bacterium]|nr:dihydropteroate synthase [Planctomycetota bacterium]
MGCRQVATVEQFLRGAARKSFLGKVLQIDSPTQRDPASRAGAAWAAEAGVAILRVHAVAPTVQFVHTLDAIRSAGSERGS